MNDERSYPPPPTNFLLAFKCHRSSRPFYTASFGLRRCHSRTFTLTVIGSGTYKPLQLQQLILRAMSVILVHLRIFSPWILLRSETQSIALCIARYATLTLSPIATTSQCRKSSLGKTASLITDIWLYICYIYRTFKQTGKDSTLLKTFEQTI